MPLQPFSLGSATDVQPDGKGDRRAESSSSVYGVDVRRTLTARNQPMKRRVSAPLRLCRELRLQRLVLVAVVVLVAGVLSNTKLLLFPPSLRGCSGCCYCYAAVVVLYKVTVLLPPPAPFLLSL